MNSVIFHSDIDIRVYWKVMKTLNAKQNTWPVCTLNLIHRHHITHDDLTATMNTKATATLTQNHISTLHFLFLPSIKMKKKQKKEKYDGQNKTNTKRFLFCCSLRFCLHRFTDNSSSVLFQQFFFRFASCRKKFLVHLRWEMILFCSLNWMNWRLYCRMKHLNFHFLICSMNNINETVQVFHHFPP